MYKISEYLKDERIILELKSKKKEEAIRELCELLKGSPEITDFNKFVEEVFEREKLGSTGIGQGVALPHARSSYLNKFVVCFGRSQRGVDFESIDSEPVKLIFLLGTPKDDVENYLKTLAHLSRLLRKEDFRERLLKAETKEEIIEIFKKYEEC